MNDILHSLAEDFSAHMMMKNIASEPIDAYLGPLAKIMGKTPTQDDVLEAFDNKCEALANVLGPIVEVELAPGVVREIFRSGIRNYYGPAIDKRLTD